MTDDPFPTDGVILSHLLVVADLARSTGIAFVVPGDRQRVSHEFTIRVPDCHAAYRVLSGRGADFLTPPYEWGAETRCFFRDPDGNLLEISSVA